MTDARLLGTVALGGALGSVGRYAVGLALPEAPAFPWGTLVVNVSGAVAMGVLVAWLVATPGHHRLVRPFVGVGLLGGWTTFSAYAADAHALTGAGRGGLAAAYVGLSLVLGVLGVAAGVGLGRTVWRDRP